MDGRIKKIGGGRFALIVAPAFVVALTVVTWHGFGESNHREMFFFGIVLVWSAMARFPGAWIGARIGPVARHAVGWLAAFLTAGVVVLILNFRERPGSLGEDYRGGLGAAAWICGAMTATLIEISAGAVESLWPKKSDPAHSVATKPQPWPESATCGRAAVPAVHGRSAYK